MPENKHALNAIRNEMLERNKPDPDTGVMPKIQPPVVGDFGRSLVIKKGKDIPLRREGEQAVLDLLARTIVDQFLRFEWEVSIFSESTRLRAEVTYRTPTQDEVNAAVQDAADRIGLEMPVVASLVEEGEIQEDDDANG